MSDQTMTHLYTFLSSFGLVIFIVTFSKVYERFLQRRIKNKFLNEPNNKICFGIFITGLAIFIFIFLVNAAGYKLPHIWNLGGFAAIIGGLLGLIPFTFAKLLRKNHK